jgi:nicotinamide riboside kinase
MEAKSEIKKIVIIGPESTGKSTLCTQLAEHYNTVWVREYAREYLEKNGTDYTFENLYDIAQGQLKGEDEMTNDKRRMTNGKTTDNRQPTTDETTTDHRRTTNESTTDLNLQPSTFNVKPIFIDTDLYVMKVWSEFVFNKCDNRILTQITKRKYDLYLLCNTDLPWVADNLREYPDLESREKLFHHYKEQMTEQHVPWVIISGGYEERLAMAIRAVDQLIG